MRTALSVKQRNENATSDAAASNKVAVRNAPAGGGKLTRQIGSTNLLREASIVKKVDYSPLIKTDAKENFEVFEDPEPDPAENASNTLRDEADDNVTEKETSTTDNNLIHELERKMEEKSRAARLNKIYMQARDTNDVTLRFSEPPSELSVVYDDDDYDKSSVASSTFTTIIRESFSSFHVEEKSRKAKEELKIARQKLTILMKSQKEARDDAMFSSDEYFADIFKYMMHRQTMHRPCPNYLDRQDQVNDEMRTILVDWFNDVVHEYRLQKETLHLAVCLVDRVLSVINIDKVQFQLVGTTSLMIAAKYEEIFPPETEEFSIITDKTYRVEDVLRMEKLLLHKFDFKIALPTSAWFGACFAKRIKLPQKMIQSMNYILDLTLVDVVFIRYRPSDVAAAAVCFVNVQADQEAWPQKIVEDTGIETEDFLDVLKDIHRVFLCASTADYKSIFNKYCDVEEKCVALLPAPTTKLQELFPTVFGLARNNAEKSSV